MKKVTLKDLQESIWYRLLKVFFIIGFLLVMLFSLIGVYVTVFPDQQIDLEKSKIICDDAKETFWSYEKLGLISSYITTDKVAALKNSCYFASGDEGDILSDKLLNKPSYITKNYSEEIVYKAVSIGEICKFVLYSFILFVIVLLISELVRRVFYYVVLGKFFPNK